MTNREIDALVAEHIMGLESVHATYKHHQFEFILRHKGCYTYEPVPSYSTSIEAEWTVVEKLIDKRLKRLGHTDQVTGYELYINSDLEYEFRIMDQHNNTWAMATDKSFPLAICKAALEIHEDELQSEGEA